MDDREKIKNLIIIFDDGKDYKESYSPLLNSLIYDLSDLFIITENKSALINSSLFKEISALDMSDIIYHFKIFNTQSSNLFDKLDDCDVEISQFLNYMSDIKYSNFKILSKNLIIRGKNFIELFNTIYPYKAITYTFQENEFIFSINDINVFFYFLKIKYFAITQDDKEYIQNIIDRYCFRANIEIYKP